MRVASALSVAALLLSACSSASLPLRSLYAAEGEHHVAVWFDVNLQPQADADSIAAFAAQVARSRGNIATYVLQKPCCTDRVMIFTIWESHEDLVAWQRTSHDVSLEHPVLI